VAVVLRRGVSLRTRLTLWYGALLALTLLAFSAVLSFTLQQSLSHSVDERLNIRADQIGREVGSNIVGNLLQPEDVAPGQLESKLEIFVAPGIYVQLLNRRGAVVAAPPNLAGGELPVPLTSQLAILEDHPTLDTVPVAAGEANVRMLTVPLRSQEGEVVGAVQVAESLSPLESTMVAVDRLLLVLGLGALLLAVVVGWLLTRRALSPVARITATARHIAETGDYSQRLPVQKPRLGRGDELLFLAATFNDMIARLEQMLEAQRRLLADTSHELRNPVTVIRGNLALLRRERVPESVRQEAVFEADEEAARMGRLLNDLLLLARADAGEPPPLQCLPVDLADLAAEVVEQARPSAGQRDLTFTMTTPVWVMGDRDRLKQLVSNLIENAIRYTPADGCIAVKLGTEVQHAGGAVRSRSALEAHMAVLSVSDTGIGIASTDLPHVFERFYRADKARSRAGGGSGLGLSIAQYIAQAHGGSMEALSEGPNRGSTFRARLPLLVRPAAADPRTEMASPSVPSRPSVLSALLLSCWLVFAGTRSAAAAEVAPTPPAPAGLAVDADGSVYVTDYTFDRVVKFGPDGSVLLQWGTSGNGPGQFNAPFGVAVGSDGTVYVSDQLNNRVQRFGSDGSALAAWGKGGAGKGELRTPFGTAINGGRLYVADFGNDRVQVFATDGSALTSLGARGSGDGQFLRPAGVAVGADGSIYVADHFNDRIVKFNSEGHFQAALGTLPEVQVRRPEGLALDRDGNLWVADYGRDRVVKLSASDGHLLIALGTRGSASGEFSGPKGVAVDPTSGRLFVADTGNGRVQRFTADGTFEVQWPLPEARPASTPTPTTTPAATPTS
jgi:signal transduction histidine kinase/sugar lactone lactonase YvrE